MLPYCHCEHRLRCAAISSSFCHSRCSFCHSRTFVCHSRDLFMSFPRKREPIFSVAISYYYITSSQTYHINFFFLFLYSLLFFFVFTTNDYSFLHFYPASFLYHSSLITYHCTLSSILFFLVFVFTRYSILFYYTVFIYILHNF